MALTFDEAATVVKTLRKSPTNDELLELYALFKQATCGDNGTCKPGTFDFRGKAKWQAWNEKKGKSQEEARIAYVQLVEKMVAKYGVA
ncbi:Acyl-CoA-binding domain-containing protein 1 [Globodera pallida]|uniref:ACB domain-containing protein n=1 Tax=Globodera pallida TaxID=36090 RepID=A0A183BUF9_GLOPA|nr:Acyl-CoA-binding domain-containing protein 1 [Globodera pallida]